MVSLSHGKSPNLVFEDTDTEAAVARGEFRFANTGQSHNARRMLAERSAYIENVEVLAATATATGLICQQAW